MTSSSHSPPCPGSDVSDCVERCCVRGGAAVWSRTCASCSFLCDLPPHDSANVPDVCAAFCRLALQPAGADSSSSHDNSHRSLEIAVYILAVLVCALAVTTTIVMLRSFRRGGWRKMTRQTPNCTCKNTSGVTASVEPGLNPSSLVDSSSKGKTESDVARPEKSPLHGARLQYWRLDMDAGSVCEAFTDEEFHDALTPDSPPVRPGHRRQLHV